MSWAEEGIEKGKYIMNNLFDIRGKVALVTGGASGIGEMIATGYVESGAKVYIASRKAEYCYQVAENLSRKGQCIALPFDLSTLDGVEGVSEALAEREEKLNILVNNAGASGSAPFDEFPEELWDTVFDINLKGPFFLIQKLLPLLRNAAAKDKSARVINISSVNGLTPPPTHVEGGNYSYTISKSGMIMLTRYLAGSLACEDILVNAIAPGPFESRMMEAALSSEGVEERIRKGIPLRRIGNPEDIAGVAIFLASRASAYTTGAVVTCDGGFATTTP